MKDLLYQEEGSPNFVDKEQGVLNVLKIESMGRLIMQVVNAQNIPYEFQSNDEINSLLSSFIGRGSVELKEELDNIVDSSDWSEYLAMSSKELGALEDTTAQDKDARRRSDRRPLKEREIRLMEALEERDVEIERLQVRVAELEAEVKRLQKGKD